MFSLRQTGGIQDLATPLISPVSKFFKFWGWVHLWLSYQGHRWRWGQYLVAVLRWPHLGWRRGRGRWWRSWGWPSWSSPLSPSLESLAALNFGRHASSHSLCILSLKRSSNRFDDLKTLTQIQSHWSRSSLSSLLCHLKMLRNMCLQKSSRPANVLNW